MEWTNVFPGLLMLGLVSAFSLGGGIATNANANLAADADDSAFMSSARTNIDGSAMVDSGARNVDGASGSTDARADVKAVMAVRADSDDNTPSATSSRDKFASEIDASASGAAGSTSGNSGSANVGSATGVSITRGSSSSGGQVNVGVSVGVGSGISLG